MHAVAAGADAVGLVGAMPTGPGIIDDEMAAEIAPTVPPPVTPWLLTSQTEPDAIAAHARRCGVSVVQIVRHVPPEVHGALRTLAPTLRRVQVIHVEGDEALGRVAAYGRGPDAFLLDSGSPAAQTFGGTGNRHDWRVSARIVAAAPAPVFLAGGLTPENAGEAIATVHPFGLDVCSGLRSRGALDPARLAAFMAGVRKADRANARG